MLLNLEHKNVIQVREFFLFREESSLVIIMEFCQGGNLDSFIGETDEQKI